MVDESENEVLTAALDYAARGLAVIPVKRVGRDDDKAPHGDLVPHGLLDATLDAEVIRAWFKERPSANVAIVAGRSNPPVVIIDADGAEGVADFARWADANGVELGNVPCVETARGGRHYYFLNPEGLTLRPNVRELFKGVNVRGVDVRAGGSYAYAPPSRTAEGDVWTWRTPLDDAELTAPPPALAEVLARLSVDAPAVTSPESPATAKGDENPAAKIGKGVRDAALASFIGALRNKGAGPETLAAAVAALNPIVFDPPATGAELQKYFRDARGLARYAPGVAGVAPLDWPPPLGDADLRERIRAIPEGYKTGYNALDVDIRITPQGVTYIAGRPGNGKTTFMANLAANILRADAGARVLFITLEGSGLKLWARFVGALAGDAPIDRWPPIGFRETINYLAGRVTEAGKNNAWVERGMAERARLADRLTIIDGKRDIDGVVAYIREGVEAHGVTLAVVDYVQLVGVARRDSRYVEVGDISAGLLAAAVEYKIPVVAGAQVRREQKGIRTAAPRAPALDDLRESGNLEQDAELVLGLHSPPKDAEFTNSIQVEILKNRYGEAGREVILTYHKAAGVIRDSAPAF